MNGDVALSVRNRYIGHFERIRRKHPDWSLFVSEGDSWFSFDLHSNTIDRVQRMGRIALLRLERKGDALQSIMSGKQKRKLHKLLRRYPIEGLLFSAGGNDVIGDDFVLFLRDWKSGMSWERCIVKGTVERRLRRIRDGYLDLIDIRDEGRNPACRIFVHGYDYAIPSGRPVRVGPFRIGPWLKPAFDERGIPESHRRPIVRWLIDRFNDELARLEAGQAHFVHVRTPGTLADSEWNDEIHPTARGFGKIAEKFRPHLRAHFGTVFRASGFFPERLWD